MIGSCDSKTQSRDTSFDFSSQYKEQLSFNFCCKVFAHSAISRRSFPHDTRLVIVALLLTLNTRVAGKSLTPKCCHQVLSHGKPFYICL